MMSFQMIQLKITGVFHKSGIETSRIRDKSEAWPGPVKARWLNAFDEGRARLTRRDLVKPDATNSDNCAFTDLLIRNGEDACSILHSQWATATDGNLWRSQTYNLQKKKHCCCSKGAREKVSDNSRPPECVSSLKYTFTNQSSQSLFKVQTHTS